MTRIRKGLLCATGLIVILATGCGGFTGSHTVSPATFLLPGLGQAPAPSSSTNHVFTSQVDRDRTEIASRLN
jgi:hypothetical protein